MKIRMAVINPNKHSWYITEQRYYWKLNEKPFRLRRKKINVIGLKNDLYHLHFEDDEIF